MALEDSSINPLPAIPWVYSALHRSQPARPDLHQFSANTHRAAHRQIRADPCRVHQRGEGRGARSQHRGDKVHITVRKWTWFPTGLQVELIEDQLWAYLNLMDSSQQLHEDFRYVSSRSLKGMTIEMYKLTCWYKPWFKPKLLFLRVTTPTIY